MTTRRIKRPATALRARAKQKARAKTLAHQAAFLAEYAKCGVISSAAIAAGIDRNEHYTWLKDPVKYPDYQVRFDTAHEQACDVLEREAHRRAVEGWDEPVFGRGEGKDAGTEIVGSMRKYSDTLLVLMLKGKRPATFRERSTIELGGIQGGAPIATAIVTEKDALEHYVTQLKNPRAT